MSLSTKWDLPNTNLVLFFRFKESLPVQASKYHKRDITTYIKMTKYSSPPILRLFENQRKKVLKRGGLKMGGRVGRQIHVGGQVDLNFSSHHASLLQITIKIYHIMIIV